MAKPVKEPIQVNSKNKYEVLFIKEGPYWEGTTLHFSGFNAKIFYSLIKQELVSWTIFSSAVLNRFDLYYSRTNKIDDQISAGEFLENSQKELNRRDRNVSLEKNSKGFILKIGNRRSNNYFRIYQGKNSLKFEHEMKGKFLQEYHSLLIENRLEEFEQQRTAFQSEMEGIVDNPQRIEKPICKSVDLDFKVDGPALYTHMDVKHPVGSEILRKQNSPYTLEEMANNMGESIVKQKERFCGLEQGPESSENL